MIDSFSRQSHGVNVFNMVGGGDCWYPVAVNRGLTKTYAQSTVGLFIYLTVVPTIIKLI